MSDTEEEWTTVRRRRGARSGVTKQLKALAIPVVPLAFDALAEPEEHPAQDTTKAKKKKKGKKAKADEDDDEEEEDAAGSRAAEAAAGGKATSKAAGGAKRSAAQLSFFAWLLSRWVALLVMLGLMRAAGGSKKKRKSKLAAGQKTTVEEAIAAPPATKPAAKPTLAAVHQVPAASPAKAIVPEQVSKQQQQPKPAAKPATAAATPVPAAGPVTPVKMPAEPATAAKDGPASAAGKPAAAAAVVAKSSAAAGAAAADAATKTLTAAPVAAPAAPPPAAAAAADSKPKTSGPPPAPAPPPPPSIKYDADWGRGKFVMQSLPTAHADVVSAVAVAGDVAVSAGYDGAVKLWHWPLPGTSGGSVASRLAPSRTLLGHSGRVEALTAHQESRRLATSGRDSTLKVWDLGTEPGGSGASELASTYVYESVRSLAADWAGEGGAAAGRVLLGARSGTVLLYALGAGGAGRKVVALRGHEDEVTALRFLCGSGGGSGGGQVALSGARDGTVRLWDLRTAGGAATAVLTGLCGRVCSLAPLGEHHLVAGDCSSTVKLWDLRQLPPSKATRGSAAPPPPPPRRLPNAPGFAGSSCPTAGLWHGPRSGVLLSSCIAWWTTNKQALEEAPPSAKLPMACLNVSAVGTPAGAAAVAATAADDPASGPSLTCQYQYTLRLGLGVVTCLAGGADEGALLAGGASGALWALRLVRGGSAAAAAAERAAAVTAEAMVAAGGSGGGACEVVDALVVGADEFSDDEYENDDEEEEEEEE